MAIGGGVAASKDNPEAGKPSVGLIKRGLSAHELI